MTRIFLRILEFKQAARSWCGQTKEMLGLLERPSTECHVHSKLSGGSANLVELFICKKWRLASSKTGFSSVKSQMERLHLR